MAKNTGSGTRTGAVRGRSQSHATEVGGFVKRDTTSGQFASLVREQRPARRGPTSG